MVSVRGTIGKRIRSYFLPIASIAAISIVLSSFLLSVLYIRQAGQILQVQEEERIEGAIQLFSQIHFGSVPSFLSIMEEEPIRDFLFGRKSLRERALQALKVLDRSLVNNELIDSIYLYSTASGILSTRAGLEREDYTDPGVLEFLEGVKNHGSPLYRLRKVSLQEEPSPRNYFTLVFGSISSSRHQIGYAMVVNLSEQKIRRALWGQITSSTMYILDREGRFLSHPDAVHFGDLARKDPRFVPIILDPSPRGIRTVRDEKGTRWIATWIDHPEIRWRFVTLASEDALFGPIFRVRNWAILASIGLLAIATLGSYLVSLQISRRIQRKRMILDFLREEINQDEHEVQRALFHRTFLSRWRKPLGMALGVLDERMKGSTVQESRSFAEMVEEVFEQTRIREVEVIELGESSILIYGTAVSPPIAMFESLKEYLLQTEGVVLGGYYIAGQFGVEDLVEGYACLQRAFRIDYLREKGELKAVPLEKTVVGRQRSCEVPGEKIPSGSLVELKDLEQAFRAGNPVEAKKAISGIADCLRRVEDPELFRFVRASVGYRLPELLHEDAELLLPGGVEGFRETLSRQDHLSDLIGFLCSVADRLQDRSSLHQERRKLELIRRVKEIVEQNLSDRSLGTEKIATEVGLSAGYLRELFKAMEGVSLLEYLGRQRLEVAKHLLQTSDLSVREVCDRSGFLNYSYFITYFKKNTGYTPKEYREKMRQQTV
ncbi:MAG: hypothetical protein Kow009_08040 [Spirochaetales bacterium]